MATKKLSELMGSAGALLDESHGGKSTLHEILSDLLTQVNDLTDKFNVHTHAADGAQAGAYNSSKPQSDAETIAQGTPSSVTKLVENE